VAAWNTPAKRTGLFVVLLLFPGLPAMFGVTLVLAGLGFGAFAPHVAAAAVGALLGYRWVEALGGDNKREALIESALGAAAVGAVAVLVAVAFGGWSLAPPAVLAALALVAGVAGAGGYAYLRAANGMDRDEDTAADTSRP